ncbi:MAG: molybdate ABC transporter substrate-binding protein [Microlunatus sp.]|nr:molybdate ABC transporter substrate-binding protein [Microlunatus sp.]
MRRLPAALVAVLSLAGLAVSGCAGGTSSDSETASAPARSTLTVFAAASLQTTFTELGHDFEMQHPGTTVTFSFAGSSDLVTQIQGGAPADVFASANTTNMDKLTADRLVAGAPVPFASNTLTIAVPPDNPAGISSLADLTKPGVQVVICAPEVPCGSATATIERASGIDLAPVSEESSVTDVLNKVATGEADAGLVYLTDVAAAGDKVVAVDFAESGQAVNTYPIAVLRDSGQPELARAFVDLVVSAPGQQVLADAGFAQPT